MHEVIVGDGQFYFPSMCSEIRPEFIVDWEKRLLLGRLIRFLLHPLKIKLDFAVAQNKQEP